jgi:hypothetical protein
VLNVGDANILGIVLCDEYGHEVTAFFEQPTDIHDLAAEKNANGKSVNGNWYDLSGRLITAGKSVTGRLPKGVYIINGNKVSF